MTTRPHSSLLYWKYRLRTARTFPTLEQVTQIVGLADQAESPTIIKEALQDSGDSLKAFCRRTLSLGMSALFQLSRFACGMSRCVHFLRLLGLGFVSSPGVDICLELDPAEGRCCKSIVSQHSHRRIYGQHQTKGWQTSVSWIFCGVGVHWTVCPLLTRVSKPVNPGLSPSSLLFPSFEG